MSIIEIKPEDESPKKFPKVFIGVSISMAIASLGLAAGALINLNSSKGSAAEFGNGLTLTTACDPELTVTPFESFHNPSNTASKFTFNEIQVSHISANCSGKDFIVSVRNSIHNVIPISVASDGSLIYSVRIYFNNYSGENGTVDSNGYLNDMFKVIGIDPNAIIVNSLFPLDPTATPVPNNWNGDNPKTYWQLSTADNAFSMILNPIPASGDSSGTINFASAQDSYSITIESTDHSDIAA
jgi:hypothetical protein